MSTISNDTYAVQAMRYWWNESDLSKVPEADFYKALAYYRGQGVFFDRFGGTVRLIPMNKVKDAMEDLADDSGTKFPHYSEFLDALAKAAGSVSLGEIAKAAGSGVVDAGKFVGETALSVGKSSLMIYVAIAAFGVFVLPKILPELVKLKPRLK